MSVRVRLFVGVIVLFMLFRFMFLEKKIEEDSAILLKEKIIPLRLSHTPDRYNEEIVPLTIEALKTLEELIGFPFPGNDVEINIGGSLYGESFYEGKGRIELYMSRRWKGALAHELAHVWFNYENMPDWAAEGLCELYAYLTLHRLGLYGDAQDYITKTTSFYGGDRRPLEESDAWSFHSIDYAKTTFLFMEVKDVLGIECLKEANRNIFQENEGRIDGRLYEKILMKSCPQKAGDIKRLFAQYVYSRKPKEMPFEIFLFAFAILFSISRFRQKRHI